LQDHRIFGEHVAAIELQCRDRPLRVDLVIGPAAVERLVGEVDLYDVMVEAELVEDDVRRLRASAGGIIELHRGLLGVSRN
jgi:hypothetical protein